MPLSVLTPDNPSMDRFLAPDTPEAQAYAHLTCVARRVLLLRCPLTFLPQ
jgi:hypothetical protein